MQGATKVVDISSDGQLALSLHKRYAFALWDLNTGLPQAVLADNQPDRTTFYFGQLSNLTDGSLLAQRIEGLAMSPHSTRSTGLFAIQQMGTVVICECIFHQSWSDANLVKFQSSTSLV